MSILNKMIKLPYYLLNELQESFKYIFEKKPMILKKMDYNDYWIERGPHSIMPRFKIFAQIIEEGSTVLDIGCGDGTALKYLVDCKNVKGLGIDISPEAVRMTKSKGIEAYVCDITSHDFDCDKQYDYIIISEVLEHISNPEEIMEIIRNNYKKSILITIPNVGYYKHRLRLLFGRFPIQWNWHPSEHLRFWTVKDFKYWLEDCGFNIVDLRSSNGIIFLNTFFPNLFGNQIVFVVQ